MKTVTVFHKKKKLYIYHGLPFPSRKDEANVKTSTNAEKYPFSKRIPKS